MGTDKALLAVDGSAMARRVADAALAGGATEVVAVGGDPDRLAALGLPVVPDRVPGAGPLAAVATALGALSSPTVLVVACDLVAPDPEAMAAVVTALASAPGAHAAVPVDPDGRHQWVHAAWRRSALGALDAALEQGVRSLHRAAASVAVVDVHGLPPVALRDADVPEDLPGGG